MRWSPLLLVFLSLPCRAASYPEELIERSRELRLSEDRSWRVLGHYKGKTSGVKPSEFFVSPKGRTDPKAELEATILAFFEPEPDLAADKRAQHPQCRFPARYAWLKERLGIDPARLPERRCERFEEWKATLGAERVTVVFADAFLNNPASMYGHTFLRLRRGGAGQGEDLLDYTVNFAGNPQTANPVFYALEGIFGMFPGSYTTMPYYMKVQEYTNIESRDLWEYDLNLSSAEVDRLVSHLWEMGSAKFDYYFFSENCSYQLLTLVDAAAPDLHLADRFGFGVVPLDTVRAFGPRAAYDTARRRPSHVSQMLARRSRLEPEEAALATTLARGGAPEAWTHLASYKPERQALMLDSADDYLRFRAGFAPDLPPQTAKTERELLVARGKLGLPPAPEPQPERLRPDLGHPTHRLGVYQGGDRHTGFTEVQFRAALHDLPTPGQGYIPDSQLEMGSVRARWDYRRKEAYIEKLDIASIVTLSPLDSWIKRASWKASFGVDQARELGCGGVSCMYGAVNAGVGPAVSSSFFRREVWYAFAEGDAGAAPVFADGWRVGGGASAGVVFDLAARLRAQVEATGIKYQRGADRQRLRAVLAYQLTRGLEVRGTFDRRVPATEGGLSVLAYF